MSGLSRINTDRIDSHASIMALVKAIADHIKNPPDLKQATEDSHKVIQQAKSDKSVLDAAVIKHNAEVVAERDRQKARQVELDSYANEIERNARELNGRLQAHDTEKSLLHKKSEELRQLEKDTRDRNEKSHAREKEILEFQKKLEVFEASLKGKEQLLEEKDRSISDREGKLRQILG